MDYSKENNLVLSDKLKKANLTLLDFYGSTTAEFIISGGENIEEFDKFVERNWGTNKKMEAIPVSVGVDAHIDPQSNQPKRRGRPKKS